MPRQFSAISRLLSVSLLFRSFTIYLFSVLNNICNNHITHSAALSRLLSVPQNNCFSVTCYIIQRFFVVTSLYVSFYKERDPRLYCFVLRSGWFLFLNDKRGSLWRGKRCQRWGFHCSGPVECRSPVSVSCADVFVRFNSKCQESMYLQRARHNAVWDTELVSLPAKWNSVEVCEIQREGTGWSYILSFLYL